MPASCPPVFPCAQLSEVFTSLWGDVCKELHLDAARCVAAYGHICVARKVSHSAGLAVQGGAGLRKLSRNRRRHDSEGQACCILGRTHPVLQCCVLQ